MVRLIVTLVIVAMLGTAGGHWYIRNKVENVVEDIVKKLRPFAVIKYDSIYSSLLDSSVGVENITINPRAVRDDIRIESIIFHAPNLMFLIDAKDELETGDIPEQIGVSIHGFAIDTNGGLSRVLDNNAKRPTLGARDNAYGCGDVKRFGFAELKNMGYEQLSTDMVLDYQLDSVGSQFNLTLLWTSSDMFELKIESNFEVEKDKLKLDRVKSIFNKMSSAYLTYRDLGYNQRTVEYCNNIRGDTNYISAHIDAFKQDLLNELGIVPSKVLVDAYRKFMQNSGVISIDSDLSQAINPRYLSNYSPRNVVLLLRPEIEVNGQLVDIPYDKLLGTSKQIDVSKAAIDGGKETKQSSNNSATDLEFKHTGVEQLHKHIGDMVRIKTKHGKSRKGILVEADGGKVKVEVSRRGGRITYPITTKSIVTAEVMPLPPFGIDIKE